MNLAEEQFNFESTSQSAAWHVIHAQLPRAATLSRSLRVFEVFDGCRYVAQVHKSICCAHVIPRTNVAGCRGRRLKDFRMVVRQRTGREIDLRGSKLTCGKTNLSASNDIDLLFGFTPMSSDPARAPSEPPLPSEPGPPPIPGNNRPVLSAPKIPTPPAYGSSPATAQSNRPPCSLIPATAPHFQTFSDPLVYGSTPALAQSNTTPCAFIPAISTSFFTCKLIQNVSPMGGPGRQTLLEIQDQLGEPLNLNGDLLKDLIDGSIRPVPAEGVDALVAMLAQAGLRKRGAREKWTVEQFEKIGRKFYADHAIFDPDIRPATFERIQPSNNEPSLAKPVFDIKPLLRASIIVKA
ncbi:hypothetical protein GGX14DRAFT_400792 [Mycena pura]|uniref:Uncharacterized protein n=1 Tax=Mycena pura TaxID=153505 RepID=A0AAD6V532_9AGAR|nr:hypothetical protein GGX14DRAFT_400792 [Mycena pura]